MRKVNRFLLGAGFFSFVFGMLCAKELGFPSGEFFVFGLIWFLSMYLFILIGCEIEKNAKRGRGE